MKWYFYFLLVILIWIIIKANIKRRGFFWKDKYGNKLTFKQFKTRWKQGYTEITPLQQTKIILWSFVPLVAGIVWGLVVTFLGGTYWLTLILAGSLPITTMNLLSTFQKYKAHKKVDDTMKQLNMGQHK